MKNNRYAAKAINVMLYPAQIDELDKLADRLKVSRSELIQEAVTVLISRYWEIFKGQNERNKKEAVDKALD